MSSAFGSFALLAFAYSAYGDVALVEHRLQDEVPPLPRCLWVRRRVVARRVARDAGEQRRLGPAELVRAVVEVGQRRLLHAVGAVAEVDRVQVGGQDPVLRPALLELPREGRLLQLAADRALALRVRVLDELLCDRRAAFDDLLVADVLPDRAHDPVDVDAAVLVEALVLDRDDRQLHPVRDLVRADEDSALLAAQHRQHALALAVVDVAVDLALLQPRRVERRDLARHRGDEAEGERHRSQHEQDQEEAEQAQLANPAPRPGRRLLSSGTRHEKSKIVTVDSPLTWAWLS